MSEQDKSIWDAKHGRASGSPLGAPLPFSEWIPTASRDSWALDVACGRGRHCGVLLARGYSVVAVDISRNALHSLSRSYASGHEHLFRVQADLDDWPFANEVFDFVLQCDFLDRRIFTALKASVRPGGRVLVNTFALGGDDPSGPRNPAFRLNPGELTSTFAGWVIERTEASHGSVARSAILARKPRR